MNSYALLLIDWQKGFDLKGHWGEERNNLDAEEKCKKVLSRFREVGKTVIHVRHSSTESDSPLHPKHSGFEYKEGISPQYNELEFIKNVNSAFIGTDLQNYLEKSKINTVFIAGLTTDHCISTSTRMSANLGFETYLIEDAVATFNKIGTDGINYSAELIHNTAIASLNGEFAKVVKSNEVIEMVY